MYGRLENDGVKARCDECGQWFDHLGNHVRVAHGMSCNEYRAAWGLRQKTGLIGPRLREMRIRAAMERDEQLKRKFREATPRHVGKPRGWKERAEALQSRAAVHWERTARQKMLSWVLWYLKQRIPFGDRVSLARGARWFRVCSVCGETFLVRRWSIRLSCSRACWLERKRQVAMAANVAKRVDVRQKISAAAKRRILERNEKGQIVGFGGRRR